MAVVTKNPLFWCITPYNPLKVNHSVRRMCRLHSDSQSINRARPSKKEQQADPCWTYSLTLKLGGNVFLWNISWLAADYVALYSCLCLWNSEGSSVGKDFSGSISGHIKYAMRSNHAGRRVSKVFQQMSEWLELLCMIIKNLLWRWIELTELVMFVSDIVIYQFSTEMLIVKLII
jgi:hypothetical protein